MPTCPAGHESVADDYCDTCGLALTERSETGSGPAPPSGSAQAPSASSPASGPASGAVSAPGSQSVTGASSLPAAGSAEASGVGLSPSSGGASAGRPESSPGSTPASSAASAGGPTSCPACDEPAAAGRFCESCGYDLVSGGAPAPAVVTLTLSADREHWERMVGSGEPAFPGAVPALTFQLTGERATLGRVRTGVKPDVDLALTGAAADPAVSHHQCEFERRADGRGWVVRDSGSANGTWINDADEPLAAGQIHPLADGDRIRMGAWTCLTVNITRPAAA